MNDIENEMAGMDEGQVGERKGAPERPMTEKRAQSRRGPQREAPPAVPAALESGHGALPTQDPLVIDEAIARQMRLIERRLQNPNVSDDRTIALKDKGLVLHIFNGERTGRLYHAVHRLGWRPLHVSELEHREQIGDLTTTPEGYVCRGEKGREMFMVMPRAAFDQIQLKKVQVREKKQDLHRKGAREQRDELAEATAQRFESDEAGEAVRRFHGINPDRSVVMELDE